VMFFAIVLNAVKRRFLGQDGETDFEY
jgi:hypothetical protein